MLKLEKIGRTRDLNIILRDRPLLLNRTLLAALGYALLIHFGALFVFHISPFKIGYENTVPQPIAVAMEMPKQSQDSVSIHLEDDNPIPSYVIAPTPAQPVFPLPVEPVLVKQMEYIKQRSPLQNPFLHIENNARTHEIGTLFSGPHHFAPVSIHISGSLADSTLLSKNTFEDELARLTAKIPSLEVNAPYRYKFRVQVEQQTGEIFWWEGKSNDEDRELNKLAVQILQNLRFAPNAHEFVTSGDIEIVLLGMNHD